MDSTSTSTSTSTDKNMESERILNEELDKMFGFMTTPVSSPKLPSTPKTPERPKRNDLEDLPILTRTREEPEIIDLTNDVSSISSYQDSLYDEIIRCEEECRQRREKEEAELEDLISTASEMEEEDEVRIPCPASPTKLTQKAQWHPLPKDSDEEESEEEESEEEDGEKKPQEKYSIEDEPWETGRVPDYEGDADVERHRWWKSTIFSDYRDDNQREVCFAVEYFEAIFTRLLALTNLICLVMGIEACPRTHRIHAHLILGFRQAKKYSTLKKKLGEGQLRYLTTTDEIISWYEYVIKLFSKIAHPKNTLRWGEDKVISKKNTLSRISKRTHRDMFYDNQKYIEEGRFDEIDPYFRFDHMSKIQKWYNDQHKAAIRVNHDRLVFIYGKPGVGKTSLFSRNIDPTLIYWKNPANKWWCGYRNQPIVIVDELTPEQFQSGLINWNIIGDRNEVYVEIKGSQLPFQAQWVIVISNYSLDQLCTVKRQGLNDTWKQTFKRRCGNDEDGYRIYYFPNDPPADNGDLSDVSHRVYEIWKKKWYYDIKPFFNRLLNFPWYHYSVCYKQKRTMHCRLTKRWQNLRLIHLLHSPLFSWPSNRGSYTRGTKPYGSRYTQQDKPKGHQH